MYGNLVGTFSELQALNLPLINFFSDQGNTYVRLPVPSADERDPQRDNGNDQNDPDEAVS